VHSPPQLDLDFPKPRSHSVPACLPLEVEATGPTAAADVGKSNEVFYETLSGICVLSTYVAARSIDANVQGLRKIDDT